MRHNNAIMPKSISQHEFDVVLAAVARFSAGAAVEAIGQAMAVSIPRRTLQRRLAALVAQQQLTAEGQGRGRRYYLSEILGPARVAETGHKSDEYSEIYVPLSPEGMLIKQAVRRPIPERHPVGYNHDFLNDYRPNETFYLAAETRKRLFELGRSPEAQHPAGTYARQILNRLLIDLSWNSSRLEGNTYSLLETESLLEFGEAAEGKDALEAQMILNHKAAIELLVEQAEEIDFNYYTLFNLHAALSNNLLSDPQACGRLRTIAVAIGGTVYHPLAVPQLVAEYFQQVLDTATAIHDPFEQAFFAMVHLAYLQPFADVNKRVSRLAANIPLIRDNLCPLSFVDVPTRAYIDAILGIYELNRIELLRDVFIWAYERSCGRYAAVRQSLGQPDPLRLRYHKQITGIVAEVVRKKHNKKQATASIQQYAKQHVTANHQIRFVEVVETEIMHLHEGNIARYRLRPMEYRAWQEHWCFNK